MAAAEDGFKDGNTLEATAKAAVAAWRSAQVIHPCDLPPLPLPLCPCKHITFSIVPHAGLESFAHVTPSFAQYLSYEAAFKKRTHGQHCCSCDQLWRAAEELRMAVIWMAERVCLAVCCRPVRPQARPRQSP